MAHIANDAVMTDAYRKGMDLHAVTAAAMLGLKPDEFDPERPEHKDARQKAKAVNFAVIYRVGSLWPKGVRPRRISICRSQWKRPARGSTASSLLTQAWLAGSVNRK